MRVDTYYKSDVRELQKNLDAKLERIVARAARDGARAVRSLSDPPVKAYSAEGKETAGKVTARVYVGRNDWWAQIFDTGSLGKRKLPLKQPGRQEKSWPVKRRSTRRVSRSGVATGRRGSPEFIAYRSAQALQSGGIEPQYFFIRAKRFAEQQLGKYLHNSL